MIITKDNLKLTKENFESKEDLTVIIQDNLKTNQILKIFNSIIEIEKLLNVDIEIQMKSCSTDVLIEIYKNITTPKYIETLTNKSLILNIISLVKSYNTFNDDFFNNKLIFFNSIEQFLDVKIELQDNIKIINSEISTYFISLFRSISKTEYTVLDSYCDIPTFYKIFFLTTNLVTISTILEQMPQNYTYNLKNIKGAHLYLSKLISTYALTTELMTNFFRKRNG